MNLAIVVPCYNEEAVLSNTIKSLVLVLQKLQCAQKIDEGLLLLVDDGCNDDTWDIIENATKQNENIWGLKLAHNVGHQNALWAGMEYAVEKLKTDAVITIDADLQDDVNTMESMIDNYRVGKDIVYGVRNNRSSDSFFKRNSAQLFYKMMSFLGADVIYNHADYTRWRN